MKVFRSCARLHASHEAQLTIAFADTAGAELLICDRVLTRSCATASQRAPRCAAHALHFHQQTSTKCGTLHLLLLHREAGITSRRRERKSGEGVTLKGQQGG